MGIEITDETNDIGTCTPTARQCVGEQVPAKTDFLVNSPLPGYTTTEKAVFSVDLPMRQRTGWIVIM
jgi:hypothetical protein